MQLQARVRRDGLARSAARLLGLHGAATAVVSARPTAMTIVWRRELVCCMLQVSVVSMPIRYVLIIMSMLIRGPPSGVRCRGGS